MRIFGLFFASIVLILAAIWSTIGQERNPAIYQAVRHLDKIASSVPEPETVYFVGDIMLARDVERRLSARESDYAFGNLDFLKDAAAVIGNFEAAIPEVHEPTPNMVMRFSVPASLLPVLSAGGVTHVSLANNHALDFGEEGYHHTRDELETLGLGVVGHPTRIDDDSVAYIEVGGKVIAVLGVNATYGGVSDDWTDVLETSSMQSDVQIVYIHWGEEYQPWHSESQEELARLFVDTGADIVIGHHPHVVQDIESYKNGLIFYSLGNFIFDQYWNDDVSEGLMLELVLGGKDPHVSLLPVESKTERVRPRLMSVDERTAFLEGLSKRSSAMLAEDIMRGAIPLQF